MSDEELKEKFLQIKKLADLADVLGVKTGYLYYWLKVQKPNEKYTKFEIPKKNGESRIIYAPQDSIKSLQQKLNHILSLFYVQKEAVHGFTRKKNIITNATKHVHKKNILNIDLKDFFPTINRGRIFGVFRNKPFCFSIYISKILSELCCLGNIAPQGAPTSPILSNFVCRTLDNDLIKLAKVFHCTYTRYADDITFSTNQKEFPEEIAKIIYDEDTNNIKHIPGRAVKVLISKNGFAINEQKTRIQQRYNRQSVTGLTVNEKINITRKYIKDTKSMLYNWEINKKKYSSLLANEEILKKAFEYHLSKNIYKKHFYKLRKKRNFINIIRGRINFIKDIRGESDFIYAKLINKFNLLENNNKPHIPETLQEVIKENLWVIEDEGQTKQGTAFLLRGYGFVTCYHCLFDEYGKPIPNMKVSQNPSEEYSIEICRYEKAIDLAIFKIKNLEIDYANRGFAYGDSSEIDFNTTLTLAGYPERGHEYEPDIRKVTVTRKKTLRAIKQICVDTPIITGHSGGPMFNKRMEVVGVAATGSPHANSDRTTNYAFIEIDMLNSIKMN